MSEAGRHTGHARGPVRRRSRVAAVVAVVCAALGVGTIAYATHDGSSGPTSPAAVAPTVHVTTTAGHQRDQGPRARGPVLARSVPVRVDIPSVQIDTRLLHLGLNGDGTLQVPWKPLLAGWYTGSPTPGQLGPAIIAGHVDSWATGPAVFYRLGQVVPGAHVRVTRADSSVADFRVTAVRSYPKVSFPTRLVYGDVNRAELRLITCGTWNSTTQEYDANVVVFARLTRAGA
jgi:hypothetical protein